MQQPYLDTIPLARSLIDNRISIHSAKAELLDNQLFLYASGSRVVPRIGAYRETDAPQHVNSRPGWVSLRTERSGVKQSLPPFPAVAALERIASLSRSQARRIVRNDSLSANNDFPIQQFNHSTDCQLQVPSSQFLTSFVGHNISKNIKAKQ